MSRLLSLETTGADVSRLERVAARDAGALGELYDAHSRLLFGLILKILGDRAEAEDVLQEVFVQVWTRVGSYNPSSGTPAGWLIGIARNRAIDRLRAKSARERAVDAVPEAARLPTPEGQAVLTEQQREVQRALETLPREQRELIELAFFLGFTHAELAERFNLPLGTVKTRIRTGMLTLRDRLQARVVDQ